MLAACAFKETIIFQSKSRKSVVGACRAGGIQEAAATMGSLDSRYAAPLRTVCHAASASLASMWML